MQKPNLVKATYFEQITIPVRVAKLLKDNGMEQAFQTIRDRYCVNYDDKYSVLIDALENLCGHVDNDYDEEDMIATMYFSDQTIMEYYRLCLEEARLKKIPFSETPSVQRAEWNVREWMDAPGCYYELRIETQKEWGCGIVFEYDAEYFYEFYALLSRMLPVLVFYKESLPAFRWEVEQLKRPFAIVPYHSKGAAA